MYDLFIYLFISHKLQVRSGDYRRGPKSADIDIKQDFSAGRSACPSSEGLRGRLCTGYHHTRQLVTTDRAVSITLQVSASAAISRQLAAAGAALVTSGAAHHLQTGRPDLKTR